MMWPLPRLDRRARAHAESYTVQPPTVSRALRGGEQKVCIAMAPPRNKTFDIEEVEGGRTGDLRVVATDDGSTKLEVMDMASVFDSTGSHASGGMRCVVERRGGDTARWEKVSGFNAGRDDSEQRELWRRVEGLPRELKENVFKYMDYDQVAWLADTDERFARSLASHRYGVRRVHDTTAYPDLASVLATVRRSAAEGMRFDTDDDLWIAPSYFGSSDGPRTALCRRYPVEPGMYGWFEVAALTKVRFDEDVVFNTGFVSKATSTSCATCCAVLDEARESMRVNQWEIVAGRPCLNVFALKGSEGVQMSCYEAFPRQSDWSRDNDITVHLWTERHENPWLSRLRWPDGGNTGLIDHLDAEGFDILLFKDPLTFFRVTKTLVEVGDDVTALVSDTDFQVVGYLVKCFKCTFRIPASVHETTEGAVRFVGLDFISSAFDAELDDTSAMLRHFYMHHIEFQLKRTEVDMRQLDTEDESPEIVMERIATRRWHRKLKKRLEKGCPLDTLDLFSRWTENDVLETLEIFEGDGYVLCSAFLFDTVGSSRCDRSLRRGYDFVKRPFESEARFTLGVVDPLKLKATVSIALREVDNAMETV